MTDKEAMKLALEALEAEDSLAMVANSEGNMVFLKVVAITALKERLAQPEQEPVAWAALIDENQRLRAELKFNTPPAAPVQEPVQDSTCNETLRSQGKAYPRTCKKCGLGPCIGKPKFDATPPQRTWLGLTAEDKNTADLVEAEVEQDWIDGYLCGLKDAEAKLRSKNEHRG